MTKDISDKTVEPTPEPIGQKQSKAKDDKKKEQKEELSEEDQELLANLERLVEKLVSTQDEQGHIDALNSLHTIIKTSTSSMTSVPKPLKFLSRFFASLEITYKSWDTTLNSKRKILLADVLSVLGMSCGKLNDRIALAYRLAGTREDIVSWGHEYVRTLALEIGQEFAANRDQSLEEDGDHMGPIREKAESEKHIKDLFDLSMQITPFFLKHNAEADAVDLLFEIESIHEIIALADENTYKRVCLYMISCVPLLPPPDDKEFLKAAYTLYRKYNEFTSALLMAIRLDNAELIQETFEQCTDKNVQKQLAYLLARQERIVDCDDEELVVIISNSRLSENYLRMAEQLDLMEAKTPQDIYKTHLETHRSSLSSNLDSAQQNLASSFVNAFVNAGYGNDKLILKAEDTNAWLHKNKDSAKMSATASLGLILLWNMNEAFSQVDRYTYSTDDHIKAGALLAYGIANNRTKLESDPTYALLNEHLSAHDSPLQIGAVVGLGLAYSGTNFPDLVESLLPMVSDTSVDIEVASLAALSLGLTCVGSCNGEIASTILQTLMERDNEQLDNNYARFMGLGLALLYLGKQEGSEATCETLKAIDHPVGKAFYQLVLACSYAGTGNVERVQHMLHACIDHIDTKKDNDLHQAFAVLGVALIAMGEDVGAEMSLRSFSHLMHYGEPVIRRSVPLALGLMCASNPALNVLDTLSKYSHDNDLEVAVNAIFALGVVGAGTNNARVAQMLRQLASFYYKESNCLFMVRIAQGLLHMGKGTISLHPFHSDRSILSPTAVAGLLASTLAFTESKNLVLGKMHYALFYLVTAMYPRFLFTLTEDGVPVEATVRVGQAVDVVGQAGRPKTITGFQTHVTPVLLAHAERAELATDEYIAHSHVLEGFVVLKKNPDYVAERAEK
ncbi:proteasome regulatory particle base subunit [Entomophthora muscae]|uniref:Proteasome regulatory particle base subunit n=1 Tax=Entomophthora muscae TaxID=34485 RepID=A0ACC2UPT0_9FUNG|nr:proteasome regulatory particle base subunit [Entomophthora muscae]